MDQQTKGSSEEVKRGEMEAVKQESKNKLPKIVLRPKNSEPAKEILPSLEKLLEEYKNTDIMEKAPYTPVEQKILLRIVVDGRVGKGTKGTVYWKDLKSELNLSRSVSSLSSQARKLIVYGFYQKFALTDEEVKKVENYYESTKRRPRYYLVPADWDGFISD